jgi:heptosyltransferase-1
MNILIILFGAIGDVVRALPLAERIKQSKPEAIIHWAIEPKSHDIILNHRAVDQVLLFERNLGFRGYISFVKKLRMTKYDIVLDLQRHFKSGVTSFLSGGNRRIGFHRDNSKEFNWLFNTETIALQEKNFPKIDHYQLFGDALGLAPMKQLDFGLAPSPADSALAEQELNSAAQLSGYILPPKNKRIALLIGTSWETKYWFPSHYAKLISLLNEKTDLLPILFGGKGDQDFCSEIINLLPGSARYLNFVGKIDLQQLRAQLTIVKCAVSSDSGPMHLAAAINTPVISLWGPTSPLRNAPYDNQQYMIYNNVACAPCALRVCPGLGRLCMLSITPESVFDRVLEIAKR